MADSKLVPEGATYDTTNSQVATTKTIKDWTVMVYFAGDNNLAEEMVFALSNMFSEGSPNKDTQVVALYDSIGSLVAFDIPARQPAAKPQVGQRRPGPVVTPPPPGTLPLETASVLQKRETFLEKRKQFLRGDRGKQ